MPFIPPGEVRVLKNPGPFPCKVPKPVDTRILSSAEVSADILEHITTLSDIADVKLMVLSLKAHGKVLDVESKV